MILQRRTLWLSLGIALFLAGCGGGANAPFAPGVPMGSDASNARGEDASFVIIVPHKERHRGSHFVSPSTKSISIALAKSPSGSVARTIKQNLTPASKGCVPIAGGTQCTIKTLLKSGEYTALVSTYDAVNQGGNVLSQDQSVPFKVLKKKVNTLSFVLGGVPHVLSVTGATRFVRTTSNGVSLFGPSAGPVTVTAKDADGNTIVGPGSLHYSAAIVSGGGWKVQATPNPATPNTFSITPPGTNGSSASIKITFAINAGTCAQSGVICTKTFTASNRVQLLATVVCGTDCGFTGATDSINIFKLPNITTPIATVTNGVYQPLAVAFAPNGTLFVGNCKSSVCPNGPLTGMDTVTAYAPPYTGSPVTITSNVQFPALISRQQGRRSLRRRLSNLQLRHQRLRYVVPARLLCVPRNAHHERPDRRNGQQPQRRPDGRNVCELLRVRDDRFGAGFPVCDVPQHAYIDHRRRHKSVGVIVR